MSSKSEIRDQRSEIPSPWLHRYAMALVVATLILVALGGNVTSRNAGLAVPDGFTVYGHFLWAFPIDMWVGNILHEHVHRLKGSVVGLMCIGLALWLWLERRRALEPSPNSGGGRGQGEGVTPPDSELPNDASSHRRPHPIPLPKGEGARIAARPWLVSLGVWVLIAVIVQGVMGGLRVSQISVTLAVVHGILGQLFFCLVVFTAAALGPTWSRIAEQVRALPRRDAVAAAAKAMRRAAVALCVITLFQLAFGAAMRHTGAGLAIPDFPTHYGRVLPPWTQKQIDAAGAEFYARYDYSEVPAPVAAGQVHVHFTHRVWALAVIAAAVYAAARIGPLLGSIPLIRNPLLGVLALLAVQAVLGVTVIWSGRHPDLATAHQVVGAIIIALAVLLTVRVYIATAAAASASPAAPAQSHSTTDVAVSLDRSIRLARATHA